MPRCYRTVSLVMIAAAIAGLSGATARADASSATTRNSVTITGDAFKTVPGYVHLNEVAGNGNVQGNLAEFTVGNVGIARLNQRAQASNTSAGSAFIRDFAFSDISGLVQINQTAGSGNAQGNVAIVRIAVPAQALSDDALAGAMPVQSSQTSGPHTSVLASTTGTALGAFHGKGVVQLNQTAGSGNATANGFLLQLQAGVTH